MAATQDLDLIVIGAGIYGIQAVRTYLEFHPSHKVIVLESDECVGGVWNSNRGYNHFWTQSPLDIWTFSDRSLEDVDVKDTFHMYFQAHHFTRYLEEYVERKSFNGKTLKERILCNATVERLWKERGTWHARTALGTFTALKVIDASGLTSIPNIPDIPGAGTFAGTAIHHKTFGQSKISQLKQRVVVIGGGKSAADVAYACAKSGLDVSWVIRKSGSGPAAYFPPDSPLAYYNDSNSSFHHRFMATLTPCVYTKETWWTWFLNRTSVGRRVMSLIWTNVQKEFSRRSQYDRKDGRKNGFANLKPDTELFWQNDSSSVNQRPDFFDVIAHNVKVYRQDIEKIGLTDVSLADGSVIETDTIVYCTGWKMSTPYIEPSTAYSLGIAAPLSAEDSEVSARWRVLEDKADMEVLRRFPIIAGTPQHYKYEPTVTPFRLYNAMLPIHDHSIVFLGKMTLANGTYNAEVQALFAVAVFDERIILPEITKMEEDVALVRAWQRRRYPAKGGAGNWFFFDVVPYTDAVLAQLGISGHREGEFGGIFTPMKAKALRGVIEEFKAKSEGRESRKTR